MLHLSSHRHSPRIHIHRMNAGVLRGIYILEMGACRQQGAAERCEDPPSIAIGTRPAMVRTSKHAPRSDTPTNPTEATMQPAVQSQSLHDSSSPSSDDGDINSSFVVVPPTESPADTALGPGSKAIQWIAESTQYQQGLLKTIDNLEQKNAALLSELVEARETGTRLQSESSVLQQHIRELSDTAREPDSSQLPAANEKRTGASMMLKRLLHMEPLLLSLLLLLAVATSLQYQHHSGIVASLNQDKAAMQLANAESEAKAAAAAATERAGLKAELIKVRELKDELSHKVGALERRLKYCSASDQDYIQNWTSLGADAVAAERERLEKMLDAKGLCACCVSFQLLRSSWIHFIIFAAVFVPAVGLIFSVYSGKGDGAHWVRQRHAMLKQLESEFKDL
jgi:hypothetical protein